MKDRTPKIPAFNFYSKVPLKSIFSKESEKKIKLINSHYIQFNKDLILLNMAKKYMAWTIVPDTYLNI